KLEDAEEGTVVNVKRHEDIQALMPAPRDATVNLSEEKARQDFAEISNLGSAGRQDPTDTTATAAAISEQRLRMREEDERTIVLKFVARWIKKTTVKTKEENRTPSWHK